ncbi:hypothetical protein E4U42_008105 [Claviceps africana]|uniref:Uncharacterized protein n=1 Tax=Claviceps africana TaxID=83212 RepID=A0A8K0J083_9HYPO|nr:hypothetical protein E4U42_008105 [Claviceps africana]
MGLLRFLNRRQVDDRKSDRSFSLQNGRAVLKSPVTSKRTPSQVKSYRASPIKKKEAYSEETGARSSYVPSVGSSAVSLPRAQGHVDILDARGGIRPYDFRSRVHAAGIRDYGEDVAERNMGENGVDVQSPAAREFYERKASRSTQSPSTARLGQEADQPSLGGSTYGGSEEDDVSFVENWTLKRPLSTFSLESRQGMGGRVTGRSVVSPVSPALLQRRSIQALPIPRQSHPSRSAAISRDANRPQITSAGRSVAGTGLNGSNDTRQSRHSPSHSESRSISPPCIPRYRPRSGLSAPREEDNSRMAGNQRGAEYRECRSGRAALATGPHSSAGIARAQFNLSREDLRSSCLDQPYSGGGESEFGSGPPPVIHARAAKPRPVTVAPPIDYPDWQNAVRRAVEETLAQLPVSVDWKALLEMTQNGLNLDEDVARNVPLRRLSLWQGSLTHSSTTPTTTDFSDNSSSIAGYPGSRYTMATSTDSLLRPERCSKAGSGHYGAVDDKGPVGGDDYQHSPAAAAVDEDHGPESSQICSDEVRLHAGAVRNAEHTGSPRSTHADVDSFTGKRQQQQQQQEAEEAEEAEEEAAKHDEEGSLIHDGSLSDLSVHLPGLVTETSLDACAICSVLSTLHGNPVPSTYCNHSSPMSRKQRLQALGYDYESDESDVGAGKAAPTKGSSKATKRLTLTSGVGGGLRRLKLVDGRIDESSEEERAGSQRRQGLGRKPNLGAQLPVAMSTT